MSHHLVRALIIPTIVQYIMDEYGLPEQEALDAFYTSATASSLADDSTGLYGQSPLFIFGLFREEMEEREELGMPPGALRGNI